MPREKEKPAGRKRENEILSRSLLPAVLVNRTSEQLAKPSSPPPSSFVLLDRACRSLCLSGSLMVLLVRGHVDSQPGMSCLLPPLLLR